MKDIKRLNTNDVVDDPVAVKVANYAIGGLNIREITDKINADLGLTLRVDKVRKIYNSDACKNFIREITQEAMFAAKAQARIESTHLVKKMLAVITYHLDNNNLNAVPLVMKIVGLNEEVAVQESTQTLQIIMPGAAQPQTIEASFEKNEGNGNAL